MKKGNKKKTSDPAISLHYDKKSEVCKGFLAKVSQTEKVF